MDIGNLLSVLRLSELVVLCLFSRVAVIECLVEAAAHLWVLLVSLFQDFLNTEHTNEDYDWDVPDLLDLRTQFWGHGSDKCQEKEWGLRAVWL